MTSEFADNVAPSADDILEIAHATVRELPDRFRRAAGRVTIIVDEFAPEDILDDLEIDDPYELTGLYDGIPMTEKSVMDQPTGPDRIWLFRRPILDEWASRGEISLGDLVAHIYIHELAHHFGWSDEDIARIDRWWE
ncbi:metallopeptidase family protein [Palleronia sediminis]|uniref:Metallopeptidase family protein n=1 Tax=Palleronia sediminis TaxID=2547833 RepID=A0A4R6A2N7_9RHOB|nr:metallopeptidase family protein [Palleronia sediminis]TDL74923.1 metallopeptidase family protein [Palleronia sediminis]